MADGILFRTEAGGGRETPPLTDDEGPSPGDQWEHNDLKRRKRRQLVEAEELLPARQEEEAKKLVEEERFEREEEREASARKENAVVEAEAGGARARRADDDHATAVTAPSTAPSSTAAPRKEGGGVVAHRAPPVAASPALSSSGGDTEISQSVAVAGPSNANVGGLISRELTEQGPSPDVNDVNPMLVFLRSQSDLIFGSVDEFCGWLKSNHVDTLSDLKRAVSNNMILQELVDGCGSSGIKKFTRFDFQLAVGEYREEVENQALATPPTKLVDLSHGNPSPPNLSRPREIVAVVVRGTTTTEPGVPSCLGASTIAPQPSAMGKNCDDEGEAMEERANVDANRKKTSSSANVAPPAPAEPRSRSEIQPPTDSAYPLTELICPIRGVGILTSVEDGEEAARTGKTSCESELESPSHGFISEILQCAAFAGASMNAIKNVPVIADETQDVDSVLGGIHSSEDESPLTDDEAPCDYRPEVARFGNSTESPDCWSNKDGGDEFSWIACESWGEGFETDEEELEDLEQEIWATQPDEREEDSNDKVRACNEHRTIEAGDKKIHVVSIPKYDERSSSKSTRNLPPAQGWIPNVVLESVGVSRCHWISPTRKIEFRRFKPACTFEKLRKEFGADEIQAWVQYRKMTAGSDTLVVSPFQYDETEECSRTNPTPGPDWTPKLIREPGQNRNHWLSPVRRIEFKRYKQACEFEEWRKQHDNDEVRAWNEYRRIKAGVEQIQVVDIHKYDERSSSESSRNSPPGRARRATEPKVERHANSRARQKSASIAAKSSKFEEKTVANRSSLRVRALTSTKNRRVGPGQETKQATNSNGQRGERKRKNDNSEGNSDEDDDPLLCPTLWGGEVASNGERDANLQGRQKSAEIEQKTIANRSSTRVGALSSTKNPRFGLGQETTQASKSNGQRTGGRKKNGNREGKSDEDDDPLSCPTLWRGEDTSNKILSKKGVNGGENEGELMANNPLMVGTLAYSDRENIQVLPPPTILPTEGGICLHGTLMRSMSEELSLNNIVVHRITGRWSMIGLSIILDEPHQCEQFEYEQKCSCDSAVCPPSGRYTGFFYVGDGPEERTKVAERYFTLKFLLNSDGYHNVEGRGSNEFGKFSITGLLMEDGTITLCKHWEIKELKASRKLANVKLSAKWDVANGINSSTMLPDAGAGAAASVLDLAGGPASPSGKLGSPLALVVRRVGRRDPADSPGPPGPAGGEGGGVRPRQAGVTAAGRVLGRGDAAGQPAHAGRQGQVGRDGRGAAVVTPPPATAAARLRRRALVERVSAAGPRSSIPQTEKSNTKGFQKSALFATSSSKPGQKTARVTKAIGQRAIKKIVGNRSERQTRASISAPTKNLRVGLGTKQAPKLRIERAIDKIVANGRQRSTLIRATGLGSSESSNDPLPVERATKPDEYEATVFEHDVQRSPGVEDATVKDKSTSFRASSSISSKNPLPVQATKLKKKRSISKPVAIDPNWALSLVGLRLNIPENWWNECTGNTLYAGRISAINFSDHRQRYFTLEMDTGEKYRVRYDVVLCYADREHLTNSGFNLPEKPPADPDVIKSGKRKCREEIGQTVSKAKKLQKKSHDAETKSPKASIKSNSKNCLELDQSFLKSKKLQKNSHMASKKLPNASIEVKSKNCPVIKSSKKRYIMDCSSKSSSHLTRNDGLNSKDIKIVCFKEKKQISFFGKQFNGRTYRVEKTLNDTIPEKTVTYDGKQYTLASAKLSNDKKGGPMQFAQVKSTELMYVHKKGLQKELEKLCCFGSLKPEKVVARLGHLQAEAKKIFVINASKIEKIDEEGHEGCGFCPEDFFDEAKMNKNSDSIQVRIIGPTIGMVKGMLLKKRGITSIQLSAKMFKAQRSKICSEEGATFIVKNEFPSEENKQMGRFLDPDAIQANKSWMMKEHRKALSPMHQRMLIGYGVKKSDVTAYTRAAKNPEHLKHAHLKGCIDPTGALPRKAVFISGYTTDSDNSRALFGKVHTKVYLSRSPSLEPTDAKLVSVVGSKPKEMSEDDWDMLCSYRFGTIIFPRSKKGSTPLPCVIADGDLDGDDFFVIWDEKLLHHLIHSDDKLTSKARRELVKLELPAGAKCVDKETKYATIPDSKWLSKAQDKMLDFPQKRAATQLVGKLYGLCTKSSIKTRGAIDLFDKDAIAYAKAFKDSMDVQKHGGKIYLPGHLHENLPESYQQLLTSKLG